MTSQTNPVNPTASTQDNHDSAIEKWAVHATNTDFDDLDEGYIQHAKNRIIDIVGCIIGGVRSPGSQILATLARTWGFGERCSLIIERGRGCRVPAHTAAMVNGILARSFDFGVLIPCVEGRLYDAHLSETTVPTALAVSEAWHRSGREMITALIVGDDIASRLIAASNYAAGLNWDSTGTVNRFGAVATAGYLLRLDPDQMKNAFGIILDQLSGSFQSINDRVHSFRLSQGMSGRDGVVAAELASVGWLGSRDPLVGRYGYFNLFCSDPHDTRILTKDLGKAYYADSIFKPYPCCRQMHIFIDCALKIVDENKNLSAKDIDSVVVKTSSRVARGPLNAPFAAGQFPLGSAMFSIAYNVANVLLRKEVNLVHYTEEFINNADIKDLSDRVRIISDDIRDEDSLDLAEITVRTKDDHELVGSVHYARGHPFFKSLSQQEIEEKFMRNLAFSQIVPAARGKELLNLLGRLEEVDDIGRVAKLISEGN